MSDNEIGRLDSLTAKQREVLDLLIQHKTSKEIARELGISPHTVDQRIQFAKDRLGTDSRSEAAVEYRRLVQLRQSLTTRTHDPSEHPAREESRSVDEATLPDFARPRDAKDEILVGPLGRDEPDKKVGEGSGYHVVPALFEGRYGTLVRLSAIVAITVLLLFLALGGVAIFDLLSRDFAR